MKSMKLSSQHNSLILKHKCAFISCFYYFNTAFCVILLSSVKKKSLSQKQKTILSQTEWFSFRILCRMDIYFKRIVIYQSGITKNISNTQSVTMLSKLHFPLIFSALKNIAEINSLAYPAQLLPQKLVSLCFPLKIFFISLEG